MSVEQSYRLWYAVALFYNRSENLVDFWKSKKLVTRSKTILKVSWSSMVYGSGLLNRRGLNLHRFKSYTHRQL